MLKVVLLGKTGHGKSSTGNSILDSAYTETRKVQTSSVCMDDKVISVIDTPGLSDSQSDCEELISSGQDNLTTRLNKVYKELEAIEADKAPAKAAMILNGLGYQTSDQQRPTRMDIFQKERLHPLHGSVDFQLRIDCDFPSTQEDADRIGALAAQEIQSQLKSKGISIKIIVKDVRSQQKIPAASNMSMCTRRGSIIIVVQIEVLQPAPGPEREREIDRLRETLAQLYIHNPDAQIVFYDGETMYDVRQFQFVDPNGEGEKCEVQICPEQKDECDTEDPFLYNRCPKDSYHDKFIPIKELSLSHLPENMRHYSVLEFLRHQAARTVKLVVTYVSKERLPKYAYLGGKHSGTGDISSVDVTDPYQLEMCAGFDPRTTFVIQTAAHVVYDQSEVDNVWVELFYDDLDKSDVVRAKGTKMVNVDIERDISIFLCQVSGLEDAEKVRHRIEKFQRERILRTAIKGLSGIIISHPHGSTKRVAFGDVKRSRQSFDNFDFKLLVHSSCDILGVDFKKALYMFISDFLCEDYSKSCFTAECIGYISSNKPALMEHLQTIGLILQPTRAEYLDMMKSYHKLMKDCLEKSDDCFVEQFGHLNSAQKDLSRKDALTMGILHDIVDELPHNVFEMTESKELENDVVQEIFNYLQQANINFRQPQKFSYSVKSCPGSSGAPVFVLEGGENLKAHLLIHKNYSSATGNESFAEFSVVS